jgi:tRNA threonylcarbamoyladenosine biosynthesis protein TsaB
VTLILNIETSTTNCSVSISKDEEIIASEEKDFKNYSHSEVLHIYINDLFRKSGLAINDISAVSISEGPGSYTGLRIGSATAKGICFALKIPLIPLDTMDILAKKIKSKTGYIIPSLDAGRNEIYYSVFDYTFQKIEPTNFKELNTKSFEKYLDSESVYFIGNANNKLKNFLSSRNAVFSKKELPSSLEMAGLSFEKFSRNEFIDIEYFEPNYLKNFIKK